MDRVFAPPLEGHLRMRVFAGVLEGIHLLAYDNSIRDNRFSWAYHIATVVACAAIELDVRAMCSLACGSIRSHFVSSVVRTYG